jgi:hypothetical protein
MSVKRHYKKILKYMRKATKDALEQLAKSMVESGHYITLRGTAQFIEWALRLHKTTGSYVTSQTIRLHEKELEEMCQAEMLKRNPLKKDIIIPKQFDDDVDSDFDDDDYDAFEDEEFYWACGDMVDHDAVIRRALQLIVNKMDAESEERLKSFDDDDVFEVLKDEVEDSKDVVTYSMFYVGEDGLTWRHGKFVHQPVGTPGLRYVNSAGIVTKERGYASYMLTQKPNNYTEGDVDILTKVATGTYNSL